MPERSRRDKDIEIIIVDLPDRINRFEKAILEGIHDLKNDVQTLIQETRTMSAELDRVKASVSKLTTVAASSNALLSRLAQMIRDLKDNPAALTALADEIDTDTAGITQAVTDNTPAEE